MLPGRDGPPGADYNTRPALKDKALQLAAFYWYEDDADYLELLAGTEGGRPGQTEIGPYAERLARASGAGSTLAGCAGTRRIV